jgi:putative ABC transport system permease protein
MLAATALGVGAVAVLTGLGEGARRYVMNEFASLGTSLVVVLPGRTETGGGAAFMFTGETTRDLTIEDALALGRHPAVRRIAPLNVGSAAATALGREREVPVLGSSAEMLAIRHWTMAQGSFLPAMALDAASPIVVLGAKVRRELFGNAPALGEWIRLGDRRFRVIGVLASEGRSIGMDVEEVVVIPVASAGQLFNTPSLFRILVEAVDPDAIPNVSAHILRTIRERHAGEEDVTLVTQDAVLTTFDRVLRALTLAVGGIAAISLAVAGILIMNVMLIAVSQRRAEVGLLKALGASPATIMRLFLLEAGLLSTVGALLGVALGTAASLAIVHYYPLLPAYPPWWAVLAAMLTAVGSGVLFAVLPARRAAALDSALALSRR